MQTMQNVLTKSRFSVMQPSGYINAANADDFRQELAHHLIQDQPSGLLVDLSQVEALDSAGLMALVSGLTMAQNRRQRFGLCGISPSLRIIFEVTQLDRVFDIFDHQTAFEATIA
jgi:anti-anti-sigma factor